MRTTENNRRTLNSFLAQEGFPEMQLWCIDDEQQKKHDVATLTTVRNRKPKNVQDGDTAIHRAARVGNEDIINIILNYGVDVNQARTDNGVTPLLLAANEGQLAVAKLLLDRGAEVNQALTYGHTPLWCAAEMGRLDVAKLLIDSGANVNLALTSGHTPLWCAAEKGQLDVAKLLIESGAKVNQAPTHGATPLLIAAEKGQLDVAKLLIDSGANVNLAKTNGETPLLIAEEKGHTAIVGLLKKYQAFEKNISAGDKKRIINEIARGYNIRTSDICLAIEKSQTDIALYFIEQVQDVNILNGNCEVPLVEATLKGNSRVIKALLDKGADPNLQNSNERSAIDVARIKGNKKLQKLFTPTAKTVTASSPYSAGAAEEMPSAPPYETTIQYQGKLAKAKPVNVIETPPVVATVVDENPPLSHVERLHRERANPAIQSCCSIS